MSNKKKDLRPDDLPPEVERQIEEDLEEERADRSPADWWEDHLDATDDSDAEALTKALAGLESAGCSPVEILEHLREIEIWAQKYSLIPARKLRRFMKRILALANQIEELTYVPDAGRVVNDLRGLAKVWEPLLKTLKSDGARLSNEKKKLTRYVNRKVKERGRFGKGRADKAVALLVAEVTSTKGTHHAIRVARSRMKPKEQHVKDRKSRPARHLPGSRLTGGRRKWVSLKQADSEQGDDD